MDHLEIFLRTDLENIEKSKKALNNIFPESLILIEHYINYFNDIFSEFGENCDYDLYKNIVEKWAKDLNINDNKLLEYLLKAVLIDNSDKEDITKTAKDSLNKALTIIARIILLMRLQRDFLFGLSDLLKLRLTSTIGYIRLQAETTAILKIMTENNSIALDWLFSEKVINKEFYRKWHKKIKNAVKFLHLDGDYNLGSSFSLHSRVGGIANGILIGFKERKKGELVLNFQEIDNPKDLFFWFGYYLIFHKKIIDSFPILFPEIKKSPVFNNNYNSIEFLANKVWSISKSLKDELKDYYHNSGT